MRKIERQMIQAIVDNKDWSKDNTRVESNGTYLDVFLHGHKIAVYYPNSMNLHINNCGYETNTTKSRLNALGTFVLGCSLIWQKNWEWFYVNKDGVTDEFPSNQWVAL